MPTRVPPDARPDETARRPEFCWREILRLAAEGIYPSEARLEQMLDRIEGLP